MEEVSVRLYEKIVRLYGNIKRSLGAADQSKLAMINIANCQELKDLGFKLLIGVHDELIGEAPLQNAKRCGELLSECMRNAAADILKLPAKCDVSITKCWYGEEITV